MSIKISKISYFSFTFKVNEKKKLLLKKLVWWGELQGNFCWRGDLIFNRRGGRGWKYFRKIGGAGGGSLTKKEWRKKKTGSCDPQRNGVSCAMSWSSMKLTFKKTDTHTKTNTALESFGEKLWISPNIWQIIKLLH